MSGVTVAAAIAAVLFMSAGAAQASGRPFVNSAKVSLPPLTIAMSIEHRRQANHHVAWPALIASTKLASRHRPASKPIATRLAAMVPDCLRTDQLTSSFTLRAEEALAAGDIRFVDRIVTSSLPRVPSVINLSSSLDFRVGDITPSDAMKFAEIQPVEPPSIWIRHYVSH